MKKLVLFICFALLASAACCQTVNKCALGYVYSFGITRTSLANGVVVGGGEYVITPTMAVYESYDKNHGCIDDRPVFLSVTTGKAYECKTVFADKDNNLALLKLPEKLPCNMKIGSGRDIGRIGVATLGQFYNMMAIKNPYKAQVTGIDRIKKDEEYFPGFTEIRTSYGVQVDVGEVKTIFLCNLPKDRTAPLGSMVTSSKALVGLFNYIYEFSSQYKEMNHGRVILGMYALKETEARDIPFENADTTPDTGEYKLEQFEKFDVVFNMMETGNYDGAAEILGSLTKEVPDCAMAFELLGRCRYETGKDEEAAAAFEKAAELDPGLALCRIRLAQLKGDGERLSALEALSLKFKDDIRVWNALFDEYFDKGDAQKAADAARNALKLSGDNARVLLNNVLAVNMAGKEKEALAVAEALYSYMPGMPRLLDLMANIYLNQKEYDKAIDVTARLMDVSPENPMPYAYYGEILLSRGEKEDARGFFLTAKEKLAQGESAEFLDAWLKKCE
ncbi:MAG: tetratricopeptide repeat protein [Abditibacteriota bacterium]|nr:tetratricopeptide repeat protein [Abditibacteriota bacterium]